MNTVKEIKNRCTACRACEQICPKGAIEMKENAEGFLYPSINKEKCINCGLCLKRCHVNKNIENKSDIEYLAIKPKNSEFAKDSTSGGIATIISKYIISKSGYVFGSVMDEKLYVKHIGTDSESGLEKFRGSKYVISDTENTFKEVKELLENDKEVLYIGTACQIAGLISFLGKEYEKLLTIDIVCHGVPSGKIFQKYIQSLEKKYGEKIIRYDFRNKDKTDWGMGFTARIVTESNKVRYLRADFDPYYINFLRGNIYRESCYNCKYTSVSKRMADLTIADFWGIEKFRPEFYDKNGVSLCLVNSRKGRDFINNIKEQVDIEQVKYNEAVFFNSNLEKPTTRPIIRNTIYEEIDKLKPEEYVKKKLKVKKNISIYLKMFAPKKLRIIYKKYFKK